MSLYSLVHGQHPMAKGVVGMIVARQPTEFGRLRDAWIEYADVFRMPERPGLPVPDDDPETVIVFRVHTRNGALNREDDDIADAIESMRAHPWFVSDADDEYDPTYADFYFRPDIPWLKTEAGPLGDEVVATILTAAEHHVDMGQRWEQASARVSEELGSIEPDGMNEPTIDPRRGD